MSHETHIHINNARERMWDVFERDRRPEDVRGILASALNGELHDQHLLFTAMIDTWPKLQKNLTEICRGVSAAAWEVRPHARRGEKPSPESLALAGEVESAIWGMRPEVTRLENGFEETVSALAMGYYMGHEVQEIRWSFQRGSWTPRATQSLPARYYGYPSIDPTDDPTDRLMLDRFGMSSGRSLEDFPRNRFLIGIRRGHPGHPAAAAPLRALAAYWLAAVYGLRWFIHFSQLYGIPWRHAEVADRSQENAVAAALESIGSKGYLVTQPGTKINILDSSKSGDALPQAALIELADRQCDIFVLGQTLTSGTDESGSRALGDVHADTKRGMTLAVEDFVGRILTSQLVPAYVALNYGESRSDLPEIWVKREQKRDEIAKAQRAETLSRVGLPISKAWLYDDLGVPMPGADEDTIYGGGNGTEGEPRTGGAQDDRPHATPAVVSSISAADDRRLSPPSIDDISAAVLAELPDSRRRWIEPLRPALMSLLAGEDMTDDEHRAQAQELLDGLPSMIRELDSDAIADLLERAQGAAMLSGIQSAPSA